jgi:hypothetical protein
VCKKKLEAFPGLDGNSFSTRATASSVCEEKRQFPGTRASFSKLSLQFSGFMKAFSLSHDWFISVPGPRFLYL